VFGNKGFGKRRPALMNAMLEKERSAVQRYAFAGMMLLFERVEDVYWEMRTVDKDCLEHGLIIGVMTGYIEVKNLTALTEVQP
jgi:hypothetical protein